MGSGSGPAQTLALRPFVLLLIVCLGLSFTCLHLSFLISKMGYMRLLWDFLSTDSLDFLLLPWLCSSVGWSIVPISQIEGSISSQGTYKN